MTKAVLHAEHERRINPLKQPAKIFGASNPERLDAFLKSHLIEPTLLRADAFEAFMVDQQKRLLKLIEEATGKAAYAGDVQEEGEDVEADEDTLEAELTIPGARALNGGA
jgi:hypothetical protein